MVDRSVEVRLRADISDLKRKMAEAQAATAATAAGMERSGRQIDALGASSRKTGNDIDQLSGRLKLLSQAAVVGTPALLAIGAQGAPAVAFLTAALTAAGLAGGALIVALQGVADATKAIDAYQLDPTVANLEKAQAAMAALSPEARQFVREFQDFQPVLTMLRDSAAAGYFPGLIESLDNLESMAPRVGKLLEAVSEAGGDAIADSTASLASERWAGFLDYLTDETPGQIESLNRIVGDLGRGLAGLIMSADPGTDAAFGWVEDVADGFDRWANSDQGRRDVEGFLEYAAETGPLVQDFFVSLVDTTAQIAQAAAPLTGPVLTGLTSVVDVIGNIADSDLGTPIFAGAAALAVYNRALAVTARLQQSALGQKVTGGAPGTAASADGILARAKAYRASVPSLRDFGTALAYSAHSQDVLTKAQTSGSKVAAASATNALRARAAVRQFSVDTAKAAAPVAGLALLTTGVADKMGLTNTATLGLAGSMAGPLGAAIGGATGLILDMSAANDGFEASLTRVEQGVGSSVESLTGYMSSLRSLRDEAAAQQADERSFSPDNLLKNGLQGIMNPSTLFGGDSAGDKMDAEADKFEAANNRILQSLGALQVRMGGENPFVNLAGTANLATPPIERLSTTIDSVAPALQALGLSWEDVDTAAGQDAIVEWISHADSAAGRADAFSAAVGGLGNGMMSTATSASALASSLDALLGPNINLVSATDGYTTALRTLGDDLSQNSKTLQGNSDAAIQNRAAVLGRINSLSGMIKAEAEAGAGPIKLTRTLEKQRGALIDAGVAAGLNRRQLGGLLREMGLTPKLISTTFRQLGVTKGEQDVRNLRDQFRQLPKALRTQISEQGSIPTKAKVNALVDRYKLTEKQRRALITLIDQASGKTKAVQALLNQVDRTNPNPRVTADTGQAQSAISSVKGLLASIPRSITTRVVTVRSTVNGGRSTGGGFTIDAIGGFHLNGVRQFADGGYGADGRYYSRTPQIITGGADILWAEKETGWEAYISGKPGERERNIDVLREAADRLDADVVRRARGGMGPGDAPRGPRPKGYINLADYADFNPINRAAEEAADTLNEMVKGSKAEHRERLRLLQQAVKREEKERDASRERLQAIREEAKAINESVQSRLRTDPFSVEKFEVNTETPEGFEDWDAARQERWRQQQQAAADFVNRIHFSPEAVFQRDIEAAQGLIATRKRLTGLGIRDDALEYLLTEADPEYAQQIASGSREGALGYQALYNRRERALALAGRDAATAVTGAGEQAALREFRRAADQAKEAKMELRVYEKRRERHEKKMERLAEKNPKDVGDAVGGRINGAQLAGSKGRAR